MSGIIDFTVPTKANPYTEDVKALAEAGDGKGFEILVPKDKANKARLQFAKAANGINKTARLRVSEPVGDDVRMVFTLTAKHKARKSDDASEATPTEETEPTENTEPVPVVKGGRVK